MNFCLTDRMVWDPNAAAHLSGIVTRVEEAGVVGHVREVVRELWKANVQRYDKEALYDDSGTLGFTASKNVTNRLYAELRAPNGQLSPDAVAVWDTQSTVVQVQDLSMRFVKAPVARGRRPRFTTDFSWEAREGRATSAARNASHFLSPDVQEEINPLFSIELPDAKARLAKCKDVFLVWGGDMDGRTAGWLGLPTMGPKSWFAVEQLWFDETDGNSKARPEAPSGGPSFTEIVPANPELKLKPRRGEVGSNG